MIEKNVERDSAEQNRDSEGFRTLPPPIMRARKLAALRFVNGDRVSELDAVQGIFIKPVHDAVEVTIDGVAYGPFCRAFRDDVADSSQAPVEEIAIIVVHQVDHGLGFGEVPSGKGRIVGGDEIMKGGVERLSTSVAALRDAKDLHFAANRKRSHHVDNRPADVPARRFD